MRYMVAAVVNCTPPGFAARPVVRQIAGGSQRRTHTKMDSKRWPRETAVSRTALALRWAILPVMLLGILFRLAVAHTLPIHFDEGSRLLAVHAVAEHEVPILPSGVLY